MVLATLAQQPRDAVRIGASKMTDNERLQQLEAKIQLVTDRAEIADLVHRYGTGADRKDWKFMRSMFTDEIEVWLGRAGQPIEFRRVSADKFTSGGDKVLGRFLVTQHTLTTNRIDVTGDNAVCLCDMQARHFKKPDDAEQKPWDIGGYYTFYLKRTDSGWRVAKYSLNITWSENTPAGFKL
jgi:hypothetical protein